MKPLRIVVWSWVLMAVMTPAAGAQSLRSEPIVFGDGRVTLGGDVSLTVSCAQVSSPGACGADTGFFNYSDYELSTLRLFRLDVNAVVRANRRVAVLADVRSENGGSPYPYGLYVRIHPWEHRGIDIQAGRVPPTFGAFARRTYGGDNLMVGYPLGYQYLTSLRPDAIPADADELLRMRGRGWLSNYSIGNLAPARGLPLASAFRWDTGVQVHAAASWADATVAVTTGSLANPLIRDDNDGKQVVGRVAAHPVPGLIVGVSAARGPFLTREATESAGAASRAGDFVQTATGFDAEYSRDYYLVRVETIRSHWGLPTIAKPLGAWNTSVEGRYKIRPALYAAARFDDLGFSEVSGTTRTAGWDAPVRRIEIGGGYLLRRNLQAKLSWQRNVRDGGRVPRLQFVSAQLGFWF